MNFQCVRSKPLYFVNSTGALDFLVYFTFQNPKDNKTLIYTCFHSFTTTIIKHIGLCVHFFRFLEVGSFAGTFSVVAVLEPSAATVAES